jgi:Ran GTPase-activating protein (RanGAP) involved in mRNA processing and transport
VRDRRRCHPQGLALRSHAIGAAGGAALATFVDRSCTLASLDLADCCGSDGRGRDADRRRAYISLAAAFGTSRSLRTLRLGQWLVDDPVAAALSAALSASRSLTELDLQDCKMDAAALVALAPGVQASPTLQRLVLDNNPFGDPGAVALAAVIARSRSLTDLSAESCCFGDEGLAALSAALGQCGGLRALRLNLGFSACSAGVAALARALAADGCALAALGLRYCRLNDEGAGPLLAALRANRSLTDLRLDACTLISEEASADLGAALAAALQRSASPLRLRRLDVVECGLGDGGAALLAAALPRAGDLRELSLRANGIGGVGAAALASGLSGHRRLACLSLHLNPVGDGGLAALAPALRSCAALRSLDLGHCGLGEPSGAVLAGLLRGGAPALDSLRLEGNELGAAGASALCAALRPSSRLRGLQLSRNFIGPEGAAALTAAVARGWAPAELDLGRCGLGEPAALALVAALGRPQRDRPGPLPLQSLSLAGCFWSAAAAAAVVRALRRVPALRSLDLSQTFPPADHDAQAQVRGARENRTDIIVRLR